MEVQISQYLHRPNQVLWFEMDEFIILISGIILGYASKSILMVGVGIGFYIIYRKLKKNYPRGFFRHLPYIVGVKAFKGFPHAYVDKFRE